MWNEFEHVEDGRFDPYRDGEHGEYREEKFRYIYCADEEEDYKEEVSDKETDEKFDMFRKMYPGWAAHFDRQDELREALELIGYDPYEVEGRSEKEQREIIENLGFDYNLYNFNSYSGND